MKRLKTLTNLCVALVTSFYCIGCSEQNYVEIQGGEAITEEKYDSTFYDAYNLYVVDDDTTAYDYQSYDAPLTANEKEVGNSLNEYAVQMLTEYDGSETGNTILSPVSATMLYSMMANFTDDNASNNVFKENMGISLANIKDINSYFRKYITKNGENANENYGMSFASNLWMDKKSAVYKSFLSTAHFYDYNVNGMDMEKSSSIEAINKAIGDKMGIDEAYIQQSKLENTKSLITSAMAFNSEWREKLQLDTAQTNLFTNADGSKTLCKILQTTRKGGGYKFDSFDMMEIPYKDNVHTMYVVVPHSADGLQKSLMDLNKLGVAHCMDLVSDTTRSYHGEYLIQRDTITKHGKFTVVDTLISDTLFDIRFPKFKICSSKSLNPQNSSPANNYSKLMYQTNLPKVSPNGFKMSNVFQTCKFEITEERTSATSRDSVEVEELRDSLDGGKGSISITVPKEFGDLVPIIEKHTSSQLEDGDEASSEAETPLPPKGLMIIEKILVPFHAAHPFAIFIREKEMGTIPFACSIKTLNDIRE